MSDSVVAPTEPMQALGDDPWLGALVDGKYRVTRVLGAGGMGKVYEGVNERTESAVAIKTLIRERAMDEALLRRFELEAKSASRLSHPNTIRIYDFGEHQGRLFMVMELLEGESLEAFLRRDRRVEPTRAVRIIVQVLESLVEAHARGMVHRDLKPDNIFLCRIEGKTDFVKVLDFGVAKLRGELSGGVTLTKAGSVFGTPLYMSPEQARAQPVDGRSDIYSVGVILYQMLVGAPPFYADDPLALLLLHVNEAPLSFAEMAPDLPPMPDLEAIVFRCLSKSPDDRFDDVLSLLEVLRPYGGLNATTGNVSPVYASAPYLAEDSGDTLSDGGGHTTMTLLAETSRTGLIIAAVILLAGTVAGLAILLPLVRTPPPTPGSTVESEPSVPTPQGEALIPLLTEGSGTDLVVESDRDTSPGAPATGGPDEVVVVELQGGTDGDDEEDKDPAEEEQHPQAATIIVTEGLTASASESLPGHFQGYTFEPQNVLDGRFDTSWQSASNDGAWLEIRSATPIPIDALEIANGHQYHDGNLGDLFSANARIRTATVTTDAGDRVRVSFGQNQRGFVRVALSGRDAQTVRITVEQVWGGSRWSDLPVSEVRWLSH